MVSLSVEGILCNQEVLETKICRGYQKKIMRTLPSKSWSFLGPQGFFHCQLLAHPTFSYPWHWPHYIDIHSLLMLVSAWSACSLLYLLKAFSFGRLLLSIYSVPDFGLGPGDTNMNQIRSLFHQELSALTGAMCKQIFPRRIIRCTGSSKECFLILE